MVALAFALSCIKLFSMPIGGSVTLASMLPIMLISLRHGTKIGVATGFLYSLTQLAQALIEGDVFPYCETAPILILCLLLDYLVPFTSLGLAGIFKDLRLTKNGEVNCYLGMTLAVFIRFVCHLVTGIVIWGQWAEGMSPFVYSLIYNGGYLGIDLVICLLAAGALLRTNVIRNLIGVPNLAKNASSDN